MGLKATLATRFLLSITTLALVRAAPGPAPQGGWQGISGTVGNSGGQFDSFVNPSRVSLTDGVNVTM
jgi:hypothetical protein